MSPSGLTSDLILSGAVIREPVGSGAGYWAGAPGAFYDETDSTFYLTYRIRRPRSVAPDRGGESRIAKSADGVHFEDICAFTKDQYGSPSIERSAIIRGDDAIWRYFTSYVDPADNRWCVSVLRGSGLSALSPEAAESVFKARDLQLEGVKDPWLMKSNGKHYMFLSVAVPVPDTTAQSHANADIYNTGECRSQTGLAVSDDLDSWEWLGIVLPTPDQGWDSYCRRITSVLRLDDRFLAFYDGVAGREQNYEERTALAESTDLRIWYPLTPSDPLFAGIPGTGSVRYVDALCAGDHVYLYYEISRPDRAHDLRVLKTGRLDSGP